MNFWAQYSKGFFCIYTVLVVLKGTGIIKPNLWCYIRGPAQFFLVHMVSLHSLPAGACCRKIIFMKENRVLTFHIHLICALCSGVSSRAARCELDFLSLPRIKRTLHQYQIIKQLPCRRDTGLLLSWVTALY